jgi:GNAT superfamily N-acetyltransferase
MRIEALQAHDRTGFATGIAELDRYFRAQAGRDAAKGLAAVFVAVLEDERIGGFYCLAPATVLLPNLMDGTRGGTRYPALQAAFLPRLGVHRHQRGRGLGRALLEDAKRRVRATSLEAVALIARAAGPEAQGFYLHAGFSAFADQPERVFSPLAA